MSCPPRTVDHRNPVGRLHASNVTESPGRPMPSSAVLHVLAGPNRQRLRQRSRSFTSSPPERRRPRLGRQQRDQVRTPPPKGSPTLGATPPVAYDPVARQRDGEMLQPGHQIRAESRHVPRHADQERAVQRAIGNRVRRLKLPAREVRLHDLEPVGDPVDAREDLGGTASRRRSRPEVQHDLGLDRASSTNARADTSARPRQMHDSRVVHGGPDRRVHPYNGPRFRDW